ncbi:sufE-like protein 1, chloroplastic/mitochondrial [Olea europaea var. sylvestris]|uniref:sufE-like protein 1, chloroplastic/mitochondrial n=1 Tax=Olea europaea var. sylvestris TaxID=158386 RepID=UPI000C1D5DB7|nr:sufE-like protein 1, chloroplastic/mitochondrial [Olea europaea var. sylvestris]XP_022877739.1 sufE-like protein 1, chloroplastic/mitochondrial [Olea europaea var. sylvestris]XP_022877740.1 sufE-like protein 1, chloroplastic/mitochondrial [Olea europaea var. sylvestris]
MIAERRIPSSPVAPLLFQLFTRSLHNHSSKDSSKNLTQFLIGHPKPMSISTKIPHSLLFYRSRNQFLKSIKIPSLPSSPSTFFFFSKSITFQRIPTKESILSTPSSSSPSVSVQPIEELPPKLQEIIKLFQAVQEPKAKYEQLLFYGRNLKPLETQYKTIENKVQGCVSQVWVRAYLDSDKNVIFEADSDSVLTKGLAALLVQGLSGRPVEEILRVSPDFAVLLGLQQSLTPSRNNGFLNMLKLMQKKALQLYVESEKGGNSINDLAEDNQVGNSDLRLKNDGGIGKSNVKESPSALESSVGNGSELGNRGTRIKERLEKELRPIELEVEDISYQHAGHAGVKGSNGETHFNVKVVSEEFEGKSLVKRHRFIYSLLQDELQNGLHALSIVAKTPSEVDPQ